jgi:hypothetical protein
VNVRTSGTMETFRRVKRKNEEKERNAAQCAGVEGKSRHFEMHSDRRHRRVMSAQLALCKQR